MQNFQWKNPRRYSFDFKFDFGMDRQQISQILSLYKNVSSNMIWIVNEG